MSSIRWRMKAWNRPWLWLVFCGRHLSCWPFHLWTENKKSLLLVFLGRQSQPKCTSKPQARTQSSLTMERSMRSLLTLRMPWGLDKFQFCFFWGSLEKTFFSSESSQLWVGPRTLSSAELAWWPGIPMDRFYSNNSSSFSNSSSLFKCSCVSSFLIRLSAPPSLRAQTLSLPSWVNRWFGC